MSGRYWIGRHTVDFDAGRVSLGERRIELHWRGFEALRELAASPGQVVGRDRLFQVLWPDAVVDESNLGKVISQLRRALDDGDPGTAHIETLPGAGYRLVATVRPWEAGAPAAAAPATRSEPRWSSGRIAAVAVMACTVAAGVGFRQARDNPQLREAEDALARGKELLRTRDASRVPEALALLRRATELNPRSAAAFGALAHALNKQGGSMSSQLGARSPALEAAERAVAIDPECAECNGMLGLMLLSQGWNWERSRLHLEKAVRLNPADVHIRPSVALMLLVTGRGEDALQHIDVALAGAPFNSGYHIIRARTLYFLGRYPEAIDAANRALGIQPDDPSGWEWKSQALFQLGRVEEGVETITARRFESHAAKALQATRDGGRKAALRALIDAAGADWRNAWRRARWYAMLGETERALDELETAVAKRHFEAMFLAVEPVLAPLRGHPRFRRLLAETGLDGSRQ